VAIRAIGWKNPRFQLIYFDVKIHYFLLAIVVGEKTDLFCDSALLSQTNICGLHCGVWVIDCVSWQAYNVCVIMVSCERRAEGADRAQGSAEERVACPTGEERRLPSAS
jgi:hypothetical protein